MLRVSPALASHGVCFAVCALSPASALHFAQHKCTQGSSGRFLGTPGTRIARTSWLPSLLPPSRAETEPAALPPISLLSRHSPQPPQQRAPLRGQPWKPGSTTSAPAERQRLMETQPSSASASTSQQPPQELAEPAGQAQSVPAEPSVASPKASRKQPPYKLDGRMVSPRTLKVHFDEHGSLPDNITDLNGEPLAMMLQSALHSPSQPWGQPPPSLKHRATSLALSRSRHRPKLPPSPAAGRTSLRRSSKSVTEPLNASTAKMGTRSQPTLPARRRHSLRRPALPRHSLHPTQPRGMPATRTHTQPRQTISLLTQPRTSVTCAPRWQPCSLPSAAAPGADGGHDGPAAAAAAAAALSSRADSSEGQALQQVTCAIVSGCGIHCR